MVQFKPSKPTKLLRPDLPTEHDLPYSDNKPVDNELQILIPILLRGALELAWCDHDDWFLGANIGLYYEPKKPAVGPDGFLALGVEHYVRRWMSCVRSCVIAISIQTTCSQLSRSQKISAKHI